VLIERGGQQLVLALWRDGGSEDDAGRPKDFEAGFITQPDYYDAYNPSDRAADIDMPAAPAGAPSGAIWRPGVGAVGLSRDTWRLCGAGWRVSRRT
jgi:hypothetical protein